MILLHRLRPLALLVPLALAACEGMAGGSHATSAADSAYPSKPDDCLITVYRAGEPGGRYLILSRLTARIKGPPAPGGDINSVLGEFRKQACRVGADAIAGIGVTRDPAVPLAIVTAQAIRFVPQE